MKSYFKICLISSLIMFSLLGFYSILFSDSREETVTANAVNGDTDVKEKIEEEKRRFVASVCDEVCPNAPYLCRVAFCSVILNRCSSNHFPNTPAEVVMLDPVFASAMNRSFDGAPTNLSLMAYDDAKMGFSPCPEALYYSTTETSDFTLNTRLILFRIGKYIFS